MYMRDQLHRKWGTQAFSLIELGIVLGVVGTLIGAVWGLSSEYMKNAQQIRFTEELMTIVTNMRSVFIGSSYGASGETGIPKTKRGAVDLTKRVYDPAAASGPIDWGVFPSEMIKNTIILAPWENTGENWFTDTANPTFTHQIYICGWSSLNSANCRSMANFYNEAALFAVEVIVPDLEACTKAIVRNSGSNIRGLVDVAINGVWKASTNGGLPVSPNTASTACANYIKVMYIDFVYKLAP